MKMHADSEAKFVANQAVIENVNEKSDSYLTKQFYAEFCRAIEGQIEQSNQIFLVDVLDQLHFISEEKLVRQS